MTIIKPLIHLKKCKTRTTEEIAWETAKTPIFQRNRKIIIIKNTNVHTVRVNTHKKGEYEEHSEYRLAVKKCTNKSGK